MADVKVDEEVMTEDEFGKRLSATHWAGRAGALEDAAVQARNRSGDCYASGRDREADAWRQFAEWLSKRAKVERWQQKNIEETGDIRPLEEYREV